MTRKEKMYNIANISTGYQFRNNPPEFSQGSIRYIQMRDIDDRNEINLETIINIDVDIKSNPFRSKALEKNDILFKSRGSNNTAAIFNMDSKTAIPSHQFQIIRIKDTSVLPGYLQWYINHKIAQTHLKSNATGTATPIIQKKVLEEMEIIVPSLYNQKIIIEIDSLLYKYTNLMNKQVKYYSTLINAMLTDYLNNEKD